MEFLIGKYYNPVNCSKTTCPKQSVIIHCLLTTTWRLPYGETNTWPIGFGELPPSDKICNTTNTLWLPSRRLYRSSLNSYATRKVEEK